MVSVDQLIAIAQRLEELCATAQAQVRQFAATRLALHQLLEGVELALAAFPPGSNEALVLESSLAGAHEAARVVLGVRGP